MWSSLFRVFRDVALWRGDGREVVITLFYYFLTSFTLLPPKALIKRSPWKKIPTTPSRHILTTNISLLQASLMLEPLMTLLTPQSAMVLGEKKLSSTEKEVEKSLRMRRNAEITQISSTESIQLWIQDFFSWHFKGASVPQTCLVRNAWRIL